jgi:hypothetical protein
MGKNLLREKQEFYFSNKSPRLELLVHKHGSGIIVMLESLGHNRLGIRQYMTSTIAGNLPSVSICLTISSAISLNVSLAAPQDIHQRNSFPLLRVPDHKTPQN